MPPALPSDSSQSRPEPEQADLGAARGPHAGSTELMGGPFARVARAAAAGDRSRAKGGDRANGGDRDDSGEGADGAEPVLSLADAIGGPRGIIDSAIPTVAFVTVNAESGLTAGIIVAIAAAVGLVVLRLVRHEPLQQAFSGLFAVGFAAFIASRTGHAEGFFLPSIAKNAVCSVAGLVSVLVGRPIGGYVMAGFDKRYADWRENPAVRRAAVWATLVWIAVFGVRFVVQGLLYLAGETGWLAAANIALGLPLFGVAVLATFAIVRRLAPPADDVPEAAAESGQPAQGMAQVAVPDERASASRPD
ncbi:Protein of unknown function (DUF3159) [Parafrankia irregularis]|uniref:Intracellular septation protein A n=2 Tax=Parafrankia TaxID=2994362 RepID=A0A0S4QL99_9ACTN|nr:MULTISPECIES: DUF3159 domain-containing protein [Parafrankia]CUU55826.1 Protein of unknown function (DUF3159) [Parafrankia irregularis]